MAANDEVGLVPHDALKELTGLEFMQAYAAGQFPRPPFSMLFSIDLAHVEAGRVRFTGTPRGHLFTTRELKVNFVRAPSESTGPVICEGRVIHAGRRVATAEGRINDAKGNLLAHGSTTCLIVEIGP
jgi:hypothetical protein